MTVLFPLVTDDELENPSLTFVVSVPASLLLKTKLGVASLAGVATSVTVARVGAVESYVHVNWLAALLLFPTESVNAPAPTSTVVAPSDDGVNVAV